MKDLTATAGMLDTHEAHVIGLMAQIDRVPHVAMVMINAARPDALEELACSHSVRQRTERWTQAMQARLREQDTLLYVGPGQWWCVLPKLSHVALLHVATQSMLEALQLAGREDGMLLQCAAGAVWVHETTAAAPAVIRHAADALSLARQTADRYAWHDLQTNKSITNTQSIPDATALAHALQEGLITVHFQPQRSLATGRVVAAEALVRWQGQDGAFKPAALTAALAEQSDLIRSLTMSVFNTACAAQAQWRRLGLNLNLSVNLSPTLLKHGDLPMLLGHSARLWSTKANTITLELTETSLVDQDNTSEQFIRSVRQEGFRIAIDDFGTGHSSFAYLRWLAVDELKIDRLFVHQVLENKRDQQIIRAMASLATELGLITVAEGVEDADVLNMMRECGCTLVQGYHIGHAISADEFAKTYLQA